MSKDNSGWSYSHSFNQRYIHSDWVPQLDEAELEMMFLSVMCDELTQEECSEAVQILEDIGIKC
jgi:hypothetical protein